MKVIYKYSLPVVDGLFFLWAIVDTEESEKKKRYLEFYKTGQAIQTPLADLHFLGTCKLFIMQELCLYVFENTNPNIA